MSTGKVVSAVVVAVVLVGAVIIGTLLHHKNPNWRDTLEFSAALVGGAGVIFGAIYGFLVAAEGAADTRRKRSLELIDQLNNLEHVRLRFNLEREFSKVGALPSELSSDTRVDAVFMLGLLEDLALAIRSKIADEQVLYESMSFVVPHFVQVANDLIRMIRDETQDPTLYTEIVGLAKRWREGLSYRTGHQLKIFSGMVV